VNDLAWEIAHSVDAKASLAFVWTYMTNVANWDDPPAKFELDGPFTAGSLGTTCIPGQEPLHWRLREINPMESYTLEMTLDRATLLFEWRFEGRSDGGTRLTQHIVLSGENAAAHVAQVRAAFTSSLAAGMHRIAAAVERAEADSRGVL
jgi:Polyketide cyclase / dehydrase and lipid transport